MIESFPLVSVVIPCYNHQNYVEKSLKSVDKYESVCYYKLNKKQNTLSNINTPFSMKETRNLHKKLSFYFKKLRQMNEMCTLAHLLAQV